MFPPPLRPGLSVSTLLMVTFVRKRRDGLGRACELQVATRLGATEVLVAPGVGCGASAPCQGSTPLDTATENPLVPWRC